MTPRIEELADLGLLSRLDLHFARMLERIGEEHRPEVLLAAALASRQVSEGHVCLDLAHPPPLADEGRKPAAHSAWPDMDAWVEALRGSTLVAGAEEGGDPDGASPLVLDGGRLYLRRYWRYQQELATELSARASEIRTEVDLVLLRRGLDRLFGTAAAGAIDWQRIAAVTALLRGFSVISGGPGTGKTFTVAKILALLAEQESARRHELPRFTLVAPTGKAAARLSDAIGVAKAGLRCADAVRQAIPVGASTIHRCLGIDRARDGRLGPREERLLATDLVLVDEASMVDLELMTRLVRAVPPRARLILLGDKDQLASVEAGAVLGDLCDGGAPRRVSASWADTVRRASGESLPTSSDSGAGGLGDAVVELVTSHRYDARSGIGRLARAINEGSADAALAALAEGGGVWLVEPERRGELAPEIRRRIVEHYAAALAEPEAPLRLSALEGFRVLCAHRNGPFGVDATNALVEGRLAERGRTTIGGGPSPGTPLLITRNDHALRLYNGDVGLVAEHGGELQAYFRSTGGADRWLSLARLPPHETAFAMTVHKSQGSEFDEVVILLPEEPSPVVTRELLYTAVTRARATVRVHGTREMIRHAVERRIQRSSGLRDLLWGSGSRAR